MEKFLDALKGCPLFAGIVGEDLEKMLSCLGAKALRFSKGEAVLAEGERADRLGIVLVGAVQVVREDYYGNRSMMAKLGASDLFAEAFACAGVQAMPVSVIALEETQVLLIEAGRIMHACSGACAFHQQMIYNLMRILAKKNLLCNQKIEVTSRRSTREKLMAYLMMQAKRAGAASFTIPFDRQELADYLEVERSGLSAEIGKLKKAGVIDCERSRFTLLEQRDD